MSRCYVVALNPPAWLFRRRFSRRGACRQAVNRERRHLGARRGDEHAATKFELGHTWNKT